MEPIGPGNHDRAWNDPPQLAFSVTGGGTPGGPGARRRLMNKRVPVPIGTHDNASPTVPVLKASDGPPMKRDVPLLPPSVPVCSQRSADIKSNTTSDAQTSDATGSVAVQDMLAQVEASLNDCLKSISDKLKENAHDEIRKRLQLLVTMWQDGKLGPEVQKRMLSLTTALSQQDHDTAWALHQGLIVDYTSMCSPWMVGVKTLIAECRSQSKGRLEEVSSRDSESGVLGDTVPCASTTEASHRKLSSNGNIDVAKERLKDAQECVGGHASDGE